MEQPHKNAIRMSCTNEREEFMQETQHTQQIYSELVNLRLGRHHQTLVDSLSKSGANHVPDVLLTNVDEPVEETHNVRSSVTWTEENQSVSEHGTCTICMDKSILMAFDPCGHTFCSLCEREY